MKYTDTVHKHILDTFLGKKVLNLNGGDGFYDILSISEETPYCYEIIAVINDRSYRSGHLTTWRVGSSYFDMLEVQGPAEHEIRKI